MAKYTNWYNGQNYDRLNIFLPKGSKERIRKEAQKRGVSLNEYIRNLIPRRLLTERKYIGKKDFNDENTGINDSKRTEQ